MNALSSSSSSGVVLRLGTRKSLLAWAQSSWVARELERLNPGIEIELVGIETRGDRILDVPLQAVQGKEFFVAEIDDALREKRVDLTVHSMKDLSLERPAEFVCGAIPRRENPRDVILFGPGAEEKLRTGQVLKIGTSSPRRAENIPPFLAKALPRLGASDPRFELVDIRGNVNTRLGRVHESRSSDRYLDGVVLAFAGLIRLWADEAARVELSRLLAGVRWMVLPLRECPAAPAQGALAVECRADDQRVREILSKLYDEPTASRVARERQLLADWGGGCHQKFGATAIEHAEVSSLLFIRGKKPDGVFVEELRWKAPAAASGGGTLWEGGEWREGGDSSFEPTGLSPAHGTGDLTGKAVFVAHARAVHSPAAGTSGATGAPEFSEKMNGPHGWADAIRGARVWTSGVSSWFRLAQQGVWVEGCAENLGFESLRSTLSERVLRLPSQEQWSVLTHEGATDSWQGATILATYRVNGSISGTYSEEARASLARASHIYWSSGSQFEALGSLAQSGAEHACGPGKTAEFLRRKGITPRVFPSAREWRAWLGQK